MPFNLKGITDMMILRKRYLEHMGQEIAGYKVIIELKKPENIDS